MVGGGLLIVGVLVVVWETGMADAVPHVRNEATAKGTPRSSLPTAPDPEPAVAGGCQSQAGDDDTDDDEDEASDSGTSASSEHCSQAEKGLHGRAGRKTRSSFGGDLEVGLMSRAVWRGLALSRGVVMEISGDAESPHGFAMLSSGDIILDDEPDQGRFSFGDIELSYAFEIGRLTVETSARVYFAHDTEVPWTSEGALKLSLDLEAFELFCEQSVDVYGQPGAYFGFVGATYQHEWPGLFLEVTADVGAASSRFNDAYWGISNTTMDVVEAKASLTLIVWRGLYLHPYLEWSALIDDDLREQTSSPNNFVAGFGIGWEMGD